MTDHKVEVRDALTLHEPFASLIALWPEFDERRAEYRKQDRPPPILPKRIENREWPPPAFLKGRWLAIHAGKTIDREALEDVGEVLTDWGVSWPTFTHGAILAVAKVVGFIKDEGASWALTSWTGDRPSWAPPTLMDLLVNQDRYWLLGTYGWLLDDVIRLPTPVPCRGAQKVWRMPPDVIGSIQAQLRDRRAA